MPTVLRTDAFTAWIDGLRDKQGRAKVLIRIGRLEAGNPGDRHGVGAGVMEMRLTVGPGYRVYYVERDSTVVVLLGGGDKNSQHRDVAAAKALAAELAAEWAAAAKAAAEAAAAADAPAETPDKQENEEQ